MICGGGTGGGGASGGELVDAAMTHRHAAASFALLVRASAPLPLLTPGTPRHTPWGWEGRGRQPSTLALATPS